MTLRRWRLPFGTFTLVLVLAALFIGLQHDRLFVIPVAIAAGLLADGLYSALRPGPGGLLAVRLFAFLLPLELYSLYMAAIAMSSGLVWAPTLWLGAVLLSGMVGWLTSWLVFPLRLAASEHRT